MNFEWKVELCFVICSYNEDVKKIVDEAVEKLDMNAWTSLKNKTSARDYAVETAETAAQAARETIRKICHFSIFYKKLSSIL